MAPPAALLQDCPETSTALDAALLALEAGQTVSPVTNGDLVRKIRTLRVDLQRCNADKAALRSWFTPTPP